MKQNQNTQQVVPAPLWLQKRMRFNLQKAAKARFSLKRARRASIILREIHRKEDNLIALLIS